MYIKDFAVERWMDAHEHHCEVNVAESCVDSLTVREVADLSGHRDQVLDALLELKLTYGSIEGSPALKRAIRSLYRSVDDRQITVTHGAIGANELVYMTLVEPGDEVITLVPTYQQHLSIPESAGAKVHAVRLRPEHGFLPDLAEIRALVNAKTRIISFANPNNPTGALVDEAMLTELAAIARPVGAYVLSDEAYRGMNHVGERFTASMADLYEKGISTASMSKTYALAGLRTGWVCGPEELVRRINKRRDYNTISCPMIDDYLATVALEHKDAIIDRSLEIVRRNIALIDAWVARDPHVSYVRPHAGSTVFIRYHFDLPSVAFCTRLLEAQGVLVVPGAAMEGEGHFRVGSGSDTETLKLALRRISAFMETLC